METRYSIRMRATKGKLHLSGAERIATKEQIHDYVANMLDRSLHHSRGEPDFISIKVEAMTEPIKVIQPLTNITTNGNKSVETAIDAIYHVLQPLQLERRFIATLYRCIVEENHLSGALLVDLHSGETIVIKDRENGIRVSRLDWERKAKEAFINQYPECASERILEAIALASKVQHAGVTAEICCSDDPDYTTGYVTLNDTYVRIPHMKRKNSPYGGRIFLIDGHNVDIEALVNFLENEPVLIGSV